MSHQLQEIQAVYRFSVFRIDPTERSLWCAEERIPLTPKQFDLLACLVERDGRVVKKNELLEAVWPDTYVEEATLARNVSWLRNRLNEYTGSESLIETVPKVGYRLTANVTRVADDNNAPVFAEQVGQAHTELKQTGPEQTGLELRAGETIEFADSASAGKIEQAKKNEALVKTAHLTPKVPARRYALPILATLGLIVIVLITLAGRSDIFTRNAPKLAVLASKTDTPLAPKTDTQTSALRVNATITIKNIAVDASQEAIEAGIKVLPGDIIMVGAEGLHQTGTGQNWTMAGDKQGKASSNQTFQQADPWSLVGWIGTTEADRTDYFQVSKGGPITSKESGFLYFAVNDRQHEYADNRGGLFVTVTLTRAFDIYAETDDVQAAWGTELVMLYEADTLTVTAAGTVSYWAGGELYDLNGSQHKLDGLLAPAINARALIGKIGSRNPFKIGTNYPQQRAGKNGWFFMSVNDQITRRGAFTNNSGNVSVGIEVMRSPEAFKHPS